MKFQEYKVVQYVYKKINLIFFLILLIVLSCSRWKSIVYPLPLSLDESEIASHVLRILSYGYNWDVLDGGTIGPFTSLIVAWPTIFGLDTTLGAMRLTGCVFLVFICFFVFLSIKIVAKDWLAFLFTLPLVLLYALTGSDDFLHFNSEVFPLFLLIFANYLAFYISYQNKSHQKLTFLLMGLLLGAVPFAKLQAAPIALVIGLYSFYLALFRAKAYRAEYMAYLIAGAVFPTLFLLTPLLISGHILDFWQSYIVWSGVYLDKATSLEDIFNLIYQDEILRYLFYFVLFLGCALSLHLILLKKGVNKSLRSSGLVFIYLAIVLIAVLLVVSIPGRLHLHYLMFLPPFLLIFIAQFSVVFAEYPGRSMIFTAYYFLGAALLVLFFFYGGMGAILQLAYKKYEITPKQNLSLTNSKILSWLPIPQNSLLVWGWMPHWYQMSDLTPALRGGSTFGQFVPSKSMAYYREQFLVDIAKSSPNIIIDAVSNNRVDFNVPSKFSPSVFPEFESILHKEYTLLNKATPSKGCPEIYIKNEYKKIIDKKIAIPKSILVSGTHGGVKDGFNKESLFDQSFSEEACVDYWLLPDKTLGSIFLDLSKQESISSLMILNTQNSHYLDRASREVSIKLYNQNKLSLERRLNLNLFPSWTNIEFEKPIEADRIEIAILSYYGLGAGLNEIKIYRSH